MERPGLRHHHHERDAPRARPAGLADECLRLGAGADEIGIYDAGGDLVQTVPASKVAGPDAPGIAALMRPQLHDLLRGAAEREGVEIQLGRTVGTVSHTTDGVDVTFSDGASTTFDLVIGADGLHSQVRGLVSPQSTPVASGQAVWRAMVPLPDDYDRVVMVPGPRGKAGINAVSATRGYVFASENTTSTDRPDRAALPARMRALLSEFGGPVAAVRDHIVDPDAVEYRTLQSVLVRPPWHHGRVVLIGDAAHSPLPHLAMGAGLAVEDAIVLDETLRAHADVAGALDAFTQRRYERCRMVVENSVQISDWELHPTPDADAESLIEQTWAALAAPM